MSHEKNERFYALDMLRGMAALLVVLWHYQHFSNLSGGLAGINSPNFYPFYDILILGYEYGGLAVEFFFCLSGFIFYEYYYTKINQHKINLWIFLTKRILRLYPIFLISLILTAVLIYAPPPDKNILKIY